AWYDLKVRLEKCTDEEAGETEPMFERFEAPTLAPSAVSADGVLRYGKALHPTPSGKPAAAMAEWIGN
ncbi:MAG TPA: hypothetical protein DD390_07580, partial [Rhodospirillaceae bacterium]|nr:hypothetical protein [Rhodospirillaceae bacterium]